MFVVGLIVLLVAEVWVVVEAVHLIGLGFTLALLLVVPWVGFHFVRRQGLATIREVRERLAYRQVPGVALVDGLLILVAGLCLVVPGFITDVIGLALLLPPVRATARRAVRWAMIRRIGTGIVRS
jgi:UPF0716 protein FxsA